MTVSDIANNLLTVISDIAYIIHVPDNRIPRPLPRDERRTNRETGPNREG